MSLVKVLCICATKNRHRHLEKLLTCFLNQDYQGEHTLLIYNNSPIDQVLSTEVLSGLPSNKKVLLINNSKSLATGESYNSLGSIYNDILSYVQKQELQVDIVNHMDDDDVFLPNHISEGVKGYIASGNKAYKPRFSLFRDSKGVQRQNNVFEPSIFVEFKHLCLHGYFDKNVDLHHKWLRPLEKELQILSDPNGIPTFIYDWSGTIDTYKTSGNPDTEKSFSAYAAYSNDVGDRVITPMSKSELLKLLPNSVIGEFTK